MHNNYTVIFLFLLRFFSILLLCSFFRLKELFQVKNGLTTSLLLFFFENAKNLGRSDDAKRRKKRGWPCAWLYFFARKFNISIQLFLKISPSDVMVM